MRLITSVSTSINRSTKSVKKKGAIKDALMVSDHAGDQAVITLRLQESLFRPDRLSPNYLPSWWDLRRAGSAATRTATGPAGSVVGERVWIFCFSSYLRHPNTIAYPEKFFESAQAIAAHSHLRWPDLSREWIRRQQARIARGKPADCF
ncbi:hypothetical protein DY000_02012762 [Brassica cretica]|uniref:Uncharacterized protein n=1 Tax=Brassica cretica TaxID=69181 RepID=A0ABQ7CUS4_BRACR|nr:hypothetical protein DY000_02012762 [Brassica cretica]